jgi:hypothetical protein
MNNSEIIEPLSREAFVNKLNINLNKGIIKKNNQN